MGSTVAQIGKGSPKASASGFLLVRLHRFVTECKGHTERSIPNGVAGSRVNRPDQRLAM
jgi:hypothetical protein